MRKTVTSVSYSWPLYTANILVAGPTEEAALERGAELEEHLLEHLPLCTPMPPRLQDKTDEFGRRVCLVSVIIGICPEEAKAFIAKIVLKGDF